tara:strand:+ start:373 stop:489 length:117 start_codon:yes stop_codon:yes gene_type:complete
MENNKMIFWILIIIAIYTMVLKKAAKMAVRDLIGACFA